MRTRYATWSLAALLIGSAAGYAAGPAKRGTSGTAAKPRAKAAAAKSTSARVHPTKSSAKRIALRVHAQMAPTPGRIAEIQSALAREGTYQGSANGTWDATTVEAMRQFQNGHGLNPSGKLDAPTLQKLGLGSDVAGRGAPLPLPQPQASALGGSDQPQHP